MRTGPAPTTNGTAGNGKGEPPAPSKERPAPGAGPFGMILFLTSLGVLFLGSLVAYSVIRLRSADWPPPGTPALPAGLWVSSGLIVLGSVAIQSALHRIRRGQRLWTRTWLSGTLVLALAFLGTQTANWIALLRVQGDTTLYGWLFYFMTGLHAAHVIGGVVPLVVVTVNAFYDRYSPLRHGAIRYCAMYWHFLGGVWLALFAMLKLA